MKFVMQSLYDGLVYDLDDRVRAAGFNPDDLRMVTNSQDRAAVVDHFGEAGRKEQLDTMRTLWVIVDDGDYHALWGAYSLPFKNAMIWRIKWQFVGESEWCWLRRQFATPCPVCGGSAIDHRRRRLDLSLSIDRAYRADHPKAAFVPVCITARQRAVKEVA